VSSSRRISMCWSHPGSYLTAIALQQQVDGQLLQVLLIAGSATNGFELVQLNGKPQSVGTNVTIDRSFTFSFIDSHYVTIHTPMFDYYIENSDMFVNQNVVVNVPLNRLQTHGLLGQTWRSKLYNSTLKYIEGEVDDYVILDDDIFGSNFVYNAFSSA